MLKKHRSKIYILLAVIILFVVIRSTGISDYLTLENIQSQRENISAMVESHYLFAVVAFIILYYLIVALSIPGATILTLTAGFFFGALPAVVYVNIGATLGACTIFLLARHLIGDSAQKKYAKELERFNRELKENGNNYLLTLRFIPLFPFFLINLLAGLTKYPFKSFVWTTAVGIIPGSFVYSYAGTQLATISSVKDILSVQIISAFALLGALALVPVIYKKIKKAKMSK